jgi:hypothetical protein
MGDINMLEAVELVDRQTNILSVHKSSSVWEQVTSVNSYKSFLLFPKVCPSVCMLKSVQSLIYMVMNDNGEADNSYERF